MQTSAATAEAGESSEAPVTQGIQLQGVDARDLEKARAGLNAAEPPQPDTTTSRPRAARTAAAAPATTVETVRREQPPLAYIEFIGPIDSAFLSALRQLGIVPLQYHPENSYLCQAPNVAALQQAAKLDFVLHVTPLTDVMKPKVETLTEAGGDVFITAAGTPETLPSFLAFLATIPGVEIDNKRPPESLTSKLRVKARITADVQDALLRNPQVLAVEPFVPTRPEDEVAGLIVSGQYDLALHPNGSYLNWLENHGINGEGVTIGIVDLGVDTSHPAFKGRIKDLTGGQKAWHATFVAGHAAGAYMDESDGNGFVYGLGLAPAANLLAQDNSGTPSGLCRETVTQKPPSGIPGFIQNNSWGKGLKTPMDYGSDEGAYDQLARNADPSGPVPKPLMMCFSSGNSGDAGLTRPKGAKNILVTGNSENYRPDVGRDQSDNINEVYTGPHPSSWGNLGDGRIRPHIVAPGEWTSSANYDSHKGDAEYISDKLTWGGGSSGASPKTAAACALLTQWWRKRNNDAHPSPALLRAMIVNGAEPMSTGGPIPNKIQGWGRLNLANIIDDNVPHTFIDESTMLKVLGDRREWTVSPGSSQAPIKITLAWTDPPGAIGSGWQPSTSAIVNKLALRVDIGGKTYRANQFQGGWSYAGGAVADEGSDNLQNVFLPPGAAISPLRVSVSALNITTNCLTGLYDTPQQDFALVIQNGRLDASSTPADVFVAIDQNAKSAPPPSDPNRYYKDGPGNNDNDNLNLGYWTSTDKSSGTVPANQPTGTPTDKQKEDDWWTGSIYTWSSPESTRASESQPLAERSDFIRSVAAGMEILTGGGHSVTLAAARATAESGGEAPGLTQLNAEAERQKDHSDAAVSSAGDLGSALVKLMSEWNKFGADGTRRRAAVIVIGSGTRISSDDLSALTRLAFHGDLYLLSDDEKLLAFLAQRIHLTQNIYFRLAKNDDELAQLVRDTLAEAGGAQVLGVSRKTDSTPQNLVTQFGFHITNADRRIVLRLKFSETPPLTEVGIRMPGAAQLQRLIPWPQTVPGIQVVKRPGAVQFDFSRQQNVPDWEGTWVLRVVQQAGNPPQPTTLTAWAESSLGIAVRRQAATSDMQPGTVLISVSGADGVQLSQCVISPPRRIASEPQPAVEEERDITLAVPVSRLRAGFGGTEAGTSPATASAVTPAEAPRAKSLSSWLTLPKATQGAKILGLSLQVTGTDGAGNPFERLLCANHIELEPRMAWRRRVADRLKPVLISASVSGIYYKKGVVAALRLKRANLERDVAVTSPQLRELLAKVDLHSQDRFFFGVSGDELIGVIELLQGTAPPDCASIPDDRGIEVPVTEPAISQTESASYDYPLTSRFIPALAFAKGTAASRINRVVIHITDGGSRVDGTISWFRDPASKVSAHYIVGQDGEVVQMVRDRDIAYHAHNANADSVGIEHCARGLGAIAGQPALYPSQAQYQASAALVEWICRTYNVPLNREHILGHAEADPQTTHKQCPNAVWDWAYYMALITGSKSAPIKT